MNLLYIRLACQGGFALRISVINLQPGDRIKEDTFNGSGLHILGKGTGVKPEDIALLLQHRIDYVEIEDRATGAGQSAAKQELSEEAYTEQRMKPHFDFTVASYQSVFLDALVKGRFDSRKVDKAILPMVSELRKHRDVVRLLLMLERDDTNNYTHSIQVGTLSYYLASWLGFTEQECTQACKAGYLHDLGKCKVPFRVRHKEGPLTKEEWKEYQRHPVFSYNLLRQAEMDKTVALVALQHHEREDGMGYPNSLHKEEIHPLAQIVAVADEYVSMCEKTDTGKINGNLLTNLKEMYALSFGKLNEKPVHTLIQHLLPSFIGKRVQLSSGEEGTVVLNNSSDMFRPLVRVGESVYRDLSKDRELEIKAVML